MQLEAAELRKKNQTDHEFVVGDNKEYGDFRNHPLDSKEQYKLMLRAFAVDDDTSKSVGIFWREFIASCKENGNFNRIHHMHYC